MADFAMELLPLALGGLALAVVLEIVRGRKESRRRREQMRRVAQDLS